MVRPAVLLAADGAIMAMLGDCNQRHHRDGHPAMTTRDQRALVRERRLEWAGANMQMLSKEKGSDQDQAADGLQTGSLIVLSTVLIEPTDERPPSTMPRKKTEHG